MTTNYLNPIVLANKVLPNKALQVIQPVIHRVFITYIKAYTTFFFCLLIFLCGLTGCSQKSKLIFSSNNKHWSKKTYNNSPTGLSCHVDLFGAIPLNEQATIEAALDSAASDSSSSGSFAYKDMSWELQESYYFLILSSIECKKVVGKSQNG
jgi:hypothetical protein